MTTVEVDNTERVSASERIASLDVLRGIAILFILFINIPGMGSFEIGDPRIVSWTGLDRFAFAFQYALHGTQRGLLQLLFGAGIIIMARKAMQPDGPVAVADLHYRRNLLLIVFGLINAVPLFWFGDILLPYGLAALFLFPARLLPPRTLMILAALFLAGYNATFVPSYVETARLQSAGRVLETRVAARGTLNADEKKTLEQWRKKVDAYTPVAQSKNKQKQVAEQRASRLGPMSAYAAATWKLWAEVFQPSSMLPVLADVIGNLLLGMALFKLGFIQGQARQSTYLAVLLVGYGLGFALRAHAISELFAFSPAPRLGWLTYDVSRIALTLGHISAVQLLLRLPVWRRILSPFQASGRMPLTIYLSASFITMWVLFPGFALGLFGHFGSGALMMIALAIIAIQLVAANLWLQWYETGPLEWAWKSMAYGKLQPYRKHREIVPALLPAE